MEKQYIQKCFCTIFILIITIPLVFINLKKDTISTVENRMLSNFPAIYNQNGELNRSFSSEFENWFSDNLGFRNEITQLNATFQYKIFHKFVRDGVSEGNNDTVIDTRADVIKDYQHLNLYNETQLKNFGQRIESINSYLKENNINFYYMNCYSPHTIYPENYSSNIYRIGETSLYNQIEKEIKNNTSVKFIDTYDKLIEGKKDHQVYSKRSDWTHWNQYGAYIAYTEMMKSISKDYPNINVLNLNDFNISFEDTKYSIYNSVDLIENKEMFNYKKGYSYIKDNAPIEQLGYKNNVYRLVNKNVDGPKILIYGDSYIYSFLLGNLSESFSEIWLLPSANIGSVDKLIESYKPDAVLFECVEHMFPIVSKSMSASFSASNIFDHNWNGGISKENIMVVDNNIFNRKQLENATAISSQNYTKKVKDVVEKDQNYIYVYFEDNKDLDKFKYPQELTIMK